MRIFAWLRIVIPAAWLRGTIRNGRQPSRARSHMQQNTSNLSGVHLFHQLPCVGQSNGFFFDLVGVNQDMVRRTH